MSPGNALDSRSIPTRALVSAMIDREGRLEAGALYGAARSCGMSDQQVRLCLRRMVDGDVLEALGGRGRRATYRLREGRATMPEAEFLELAARQDAGEAPWDGLWRLAGFSIPERRRAQRDELRRRLAFLGGAQVHGGLYISPHPWEEILLAEFRRVGAEESLMLATSEDLRIVGEGEGAALASRLWPLDDLAGRYVEFTEGLADRAEAIDEAGDGNGLTRLAVSLLVDFAGRVAPDPLLPPELLPRPWAGTIARRRLREVCDRLVERADRLGAPLPHGVHRLLAAYDSDASASPSGQGSVASR